jgi:hypothetical protein
MLTNTTSLAYGLFGFKLGNLFGILGSMIAFLYICWIVWVVSLEKKIERLEYLHDKEIQDIISRKIKRRFER